MSVSFDPIHGLIIVQARIFGPTRKTVVNLALDTGATTTLINIAFLVGIGYDPALIPDRVQVTTGSSIEFCPRISLLSIESLGHTARNFPVLAHTLPPTTSIDGLLGLDFFRQKNLRIDFRGGIINLD